MKNKKLLTALISLVMGGTAIGGCLSLTACGNKNNSEGGDTTPAHHWSDTEYGKDEANHWRECTDEGCDLVYQVTPHDFTNGDCVCGQPKPNEEGDSGNNGSGDDGDTTPVHHWSDTEYGKDAANHWRECTDEGCDLVYQVTPHDFTNGDCVCGQRKPGSGNQPVENPDDKDEIVSITAYDHTQNGSRVTQLVQKLFKVGDTFNYNNLSVRVTKKVNGKEVTEKLAVSSVTVEAPDMTTAGKKTVTVKYEGKEDTYEINVIDLGGVSKNEATVTVDPAATIGVAGNVVTVNTINDAVTVFKLLKTDDNTKKVINVSAGTHHEKVEIDIPNVNLKGATTTATDTVIEYNLMAAYVCPGAEKPYSTDGSASVSIRAEAIGFHAENITFQNYWNTHERFLQSKEIADKLDGNTMAVACLVQADKCVFDNVRFSSYHDTLYDYNGRHVYNNCYMEGRTDYVFGYGATSYYKDCTFNTIGADDVKNGGYVCATMGYAKWVAQGTTPNTIVDYGYIFDGCTFTADSHVVDGTVSLARAWSSYMTLAFINCDMSAAYSKTAYGAKVDNKNERYGAMSSGEPNAERLYEYGNTGAGSLTQTEAGKIDNLCTILTAERAAQFKNAAIIFAAKNGQIEYSSAWNGQAGALIPTTYAFKTYDSQSMTDTQGTPVSLFDGAMTLNGKYRLCGSTGADGSVQLYAGSVFKLNVKGKVNIEWYPGYGTTAANAKINYKDGYATITIIGTGSDPASDNQYYIKWITVDGSQEGVHVHEYGEWNITAPTSSVPGSAVKTCADCELATAHSVTKDLPVLSETDYNITASQTEGKAVYTLKEDTTISFEADALAGVHVHEYGEWSVAEADKPTADATGLIKRSCTLADCNHNATATESKVLPKLDDAGYKITNNTATLDATGTGTYTITIEGIATPVSFTAATPKLAGEVIYDLTAQGTANVSGTESNPASICDGAMEVVGGIRFSSVGTQLNKGTVITLKEKGSIEITWFEGGYGSAADGKVVYKNGYAIIEIIGEGDWNESAGKYNGAYIKQIKLTRTATPTDTKYTVTFNSKGGSTVDSQEVAVWEKASEPTAPSNGDKVFGGWFKDEACTKAFDFAAEEITGDITLYAKWTPAGVVEHSVNIYVHGVATAIGSISKETGETVTKADINAYLAGQEEYKNISVREWYSSSEYTTVYTAAALSGDTDIYITYQYIGAASLNLLDFTETWQGTTGIYKGIEVDATSGKFGNLNNNWLQFNNGTILKIYFGLSAEYDVIVTPDILNNTADIDKTHLGEGYVTVTANGNGYIRALSFETVKKVGKSGTYYTYATDKANSNDYVLVSGCTDNTNNIVIKGAGKIKLSVAAGAVVTVTSGYYSAGSWDLFAATENGVELTPVDDTSARTSTFTCTNGGIIVITAAGSQACITKITVDIPLKTITQSGTYYTHSTDKAQSNDYVALKNCNDNGSNMTFNNTGTITLKVEAGAVVTVQSGYWQGSWSLFAATENGVALTPVDDTTAGTSTFTCTNGGEIVIKASGTQACITTITVTVA